MCGGLVLVVSVGLAAAYRLGWLATAQVRSTDFLFVSRLEARARATVIVGIDQTSYRELLPRYGPMAAWPRTLYARAVDALHEAGARLVVLDLVFDAPRPEDAELVASLRRAGNVLLPVEAQGPRRLTPAPGVAQEFDVFVRSTRAIAEAALAEGFVNVTTDRDTVVRSLPLLLRAGGETRPALALVTVSRFVRRPAVIDAPPTGGRVSAAGREVPIVPPGRMLINFFGRPGGREGPFPIIPLVDVANGTFDRAEVRDKVALLGLTIHGLDEVATPTTAERRMWGVEVLGSAIETILAQRFLVPISPAVTVASIVGLALLAAWLAVACQPLVATLAGLAVLLLYLVAASLLFDRGLVLNLVYPPAGLLLAGALALVYRVRVEQAEQRMLRGVMARYLSPSVSQWVLREPERLSLGGETRTMTVLFADLRDFTTLSHRLDPHVLVSLLNEYMTAMTEIVFRHDGVLDKYIGDAIMAFWGAPVDQPDHARRGCETALDMIERLRDLRPDWVRRGWPALEAGIGINTGAMVVGNMGSRARLAYTVIGDAVNVASRLEGLSKEYGTRVVIGEATRAAARPAFEYRFLDVVAVKGRSEPLAVYEVASRTGALDTGMRALLETYHEGIELYRARRWAEAAALFRALRDRAPEDGPSALYLRRSQALLADPPPPAWDGVFVARTK